MLWTLNDLSIKISSFNIVNAHDLLFRILAAYIFKNYNIITLIDVRHFYFKNTMNFTQQRVLLKLFAIKL